MGNRLTTAQRAILRDLTNKKRYPDGWACAEWITESCRHEFFASTRLPTLIKRGLIERGERGWYRITPAGRAALAQEGGGDGK